MTYGRYFYHKKYVSVSHFVFSLELDPRQGHVGCTLGATLTGITLAVGILTTVFSLVGSVGIGLLPPSILFAHSTFLCWYALSSHPDSTCNPWAADDVLSASGKSVGAAISLGLLMATVAWVTWHGEKVRASSLCAMGMLLKGRQVCGGKLWPHTYVGSKVWNVEILIFSELQIKR